ncbi:U-box domain-containing protein 34-like [Oryza glaberrima]|uniref:RING-type E3 ubiquitin transferase n=1 Tax=Oryza barthii TaxID=65489 RepID=A0A0D3F2I4_9ORYZ|nr:U-box domain-containing protein 34-like [Oryza glaberrima]
MASGEPRPPSPAAVAVAVRPGGSASRRAARWAAANLVPAGDGDGRASAAAISVVHVIAPLRFVPSPCGEQVPAARVAREAAEAYARDRHARAQEALRPFRRIFAAAANATVETVVLEGDGVAEALVRYAADSGVRSLVIGSASLGWFRRAMSVPDVATAVLKTTEISCNVFVVSKRRLTLKVTRHPQMSRSGTGLRIQSVSQKAFAQSYRSLLFDNFPENGIHPDSCCQSRVSHCGPTNARQSSESHGQILFNSLGAKTTGIEGYKNHGLRSPFKEAHYADSNSSEECQSIDEVAKLRKELQDTLVMYDKACEDLVHAKKKIQVLSSECSEEARKVEHALQEEEALKQVVADEKAKHLEAIEEVEQAKKSFTREAYSRNKAEMVASMISLDKAKVVDAILSTSKNCRRYKKHEIELATDNFSEARKIGEGGYGNVYRCTLDHTEVAVKVIQQDSIDKTDEFLREVDILSQLQHPNLVLLLGFCPEIGCLVYEYLQNGSLEDQLLNNKGRQPLHWFLRFQIIFDVSCGLAFLHGRKPEPIVHRDLKPANILLNKNYVGKIGDAGFAKLISDLVPDWQTEYKETIIAGTLYYMDPEYQQTGTVRPKSDLFGLGVIILQMLTGKRPNGLIVSVENAIRNGMLADILDKSQTDWPLVEAEMLAKLGLRCTALKCRERPGLESEVLPKLQEILHRITSTVNLRSPKLNVPSHFVCPIMQEVMNDPYVAADGHTYEQQAIKAWLKKHKVSPVTRRILPNLSVIPNHSLRAAIQQWKSQSAHAKS